MDNLNQNVLDDDRIGRLLWKLSLPAFLGMFVMALYNVVDTIFIGHYVGSLGIAGVTLVFPIQMLSMGIGMMMGMGGASLISRLIGATNIPRSERALGNAVAATIVPSAIIMVTGLSNVDFWLKLIGSSADILPYARDYMAPILFGMFFQTFGMAMNFLIRAEGNARVPMTGMFIGAILNIILDAIFIIPLHMGVTGAALATIIAQMIAVIYFASYYLSGQSYLKFRFRNLAIEWDILRGILAIGISSFAMTVASSLTAIIVNRMLVYYGGELAISAFGIVHRIMMFAMMPGIVIGQGLQPILGFNYGAGRYDRALRAIKFAIIVATTCSTIVFFILFLVPEPIMLVFTDDSNLVVLGAYAMKRIILVMYLVGFIMVGSSIFQSIGKAVQSFISAISRPVLFLLPLIFILSHFLRIEGVWLAFPITDFLTFVLVMILVIPQIRMFRSKSIAMKNANPETR